MADPASDSREAWAALADALLAAEAIRIRASGGSSPSELAGLRIADEDIDGIINDLFGQPDDWQEASADATARMEPLIETSRAAFRESLNTASPFSVVAANAELTVEEAEVLAVLVAVELDVRRQRLVGYIQDDVTKPRLTLFGLRRVFGFDHPGLLTVAPDGSLRRSELVRLSAEGAWAARQIEVAGSLLWALVGDSSLDPDLPHGISLLATVGESDPDSANLLFVVGPDRRRRLDLAALNAPAQRLLVTPVPQGVDGWEAIVREATLQGAGIALETDEELPTVGRRSIERATHLTWVVSSASELPLRTIPRRPWRELWADPHHPTDVEWKEALGAEAPRRHGVGAEQLELIANAYPAVGRDLDAAIRRLASGRIEKLARRVRPQRGWDDLILAPEEVAQLRELLSRYQHRSRVHEEWGFSAFPATGLVALFAGSSGTGKTLAAEVIAGALGLDLFKLDLSAVVSKYIGETEKNLEEIFAAATAGDLVLFFDEADALFGKRSEVSDARDRYANIEVAYLLQRLEAYDGLVVLATNFQKNIDEAFLRRIHVAVEFPLPEEAERRRIWEISFGPQAPCAEVDLDFCARQFRLSGGSIRNVALHAAFLAADADTDITTETVMLSLKREYQKLGRLRKEEDFGPYFDLVSD